MRITLAFLIPIFVLTSCARQPAPGERAGPADREEEAPVDLEEALSAIRELVPAAAGIPNEELARVAAGNAPPLPENYRTQPLTLGLLTFKILPQVDGLAEVKEARKAEFAVLAENPRALSAEMKRSAASGYSSLLQADSIQSITCELSGGMANGVITFEAPNVCRGKVEYSAVCENGRWSITEFRLPVRRWTFRRVDSDRWEWSDRFGKWSDTGRLPPLQVLTGHVEFNGNPVPKARIDFVSLDAPDTISTLLPTTDENGDFSTRLNPGRYGYKVTCGQVDVGWDVEKDRPTYRARDGSKLILDIKTGENSVFIDLVTNDAPPDP
jgi:hypothetical protein